MIIKPDMLFGQHIYTKMKINRNEYENHKIKNKNIKEKVKFAFIQN